MRECTDCGLFFADPMTLPMTSEELYSKAYNGEMGVTDMHHFATRIKHRDAWHRLYRFILPKTPALTLNWIRHNLPQGATVLDIGCGPGYVLHALRRRGYKVIGIEPGEKPASILKEEGFQVWQGTLENYPSDWPVPDAVTSFFMLHHLPDPGGFFAILRQRFPNATLLIADHHNNTHIFSSKEARQRSMPPRFLTWWTGHTLEQALTRAGFDSTVLELRYNALDFTFGIANAFLNSGTSVFTHIRWLLYGDTHTNGKIEPIAPNSPSSFQRRLRRFTSIPWSLWAVASPRTSKDIRIEDMKEPVVHKKVFLEPLWNLRGALRNIVDFPPNGYEFVMVRQIEDTIFNNFIIPSGFNYRLGQLANRVIPYKLTVPWLQKWRRLSDQTVLTYSYGHLVFRTQPWVVEVESANLIVGSSQTDFNRFRWLLERSLASYQCKKIICWSEVGRRTIVEGLNSEKFQHKVELVHYAAPAKQFVKNYTKKKQVKLLFVGSQALDRPFEMYGGVELLEAFSLICNRYDVELVLRASVPADVKAKYEGIKGLRIIDQVVPWEVLESEFHSADIGVLPYHTTTPHTILEMMSYEIPVVGRNCWANPEYIQDNVTGLLVQPSPRVPYYYRDTCHPNFAAKEFRKAIKEPDQKVVNDLAQKLGLLIENPDLRRRLGRAGRWEVEQGRFSFRMRNEKLGRIFDEAAGGDENR